MARAKKIGLFSQPSEKEEAAALETLDRFGMADYARRPLPNSSVASAGWSFARALVAETEVLILDGRPRTRSQEPGADFGLDRQIVVQDSPDDTHDHHLP